MIKIISTGDMNSCTCGTITDRKMLINHVVYSDAYLTGWEDEDCFIKR